MNKKRDIMLSIIILLIGLMIAGGTYAFFVIEANITNANYIGQSTCFLIDYNITEYEDNQTENLISNIPIYNNVQKISDDEYVVDYSLLHSDTYIHFDLISSLVSNKNYVMQFYVTGLSDSDNIEFGVFNTYGGRYFTQLIHNGLNKIYFDKSYWNGHITYVTLDDGNNDSSSAKFTLSGFSIYEQSQDIKGILFPSISPVKGLNGHVGIKVNDSCDTNGIGTLKLHVDSGTDSHLTEIASSHCEDKKTGDILTEYITEESCSSANGKWQNYPTSYCESNSTLQTLKTITSSSECTTNNGTWVTNGSPLKYAVYNSADPNSTPISVGHITESDIGNDITIHDNTIINDSEKYFYVYIWLDGYLTDNSHSDLPFTSYIAASATQNDKLLPDEYQQVEYISSSGSQYIDTEISGNNNNLTFDIKYSWVTLPASEAYAYVIGAYENENSVSTRILQYGPSTTYFNINTKAGGGSGVYNVTRSVGTIYNELLSSSGTRLTYNSNGTVTNKDYVAGDDIDNNVCVFASSRKTAYSKIKLYYLKIHDGGNLVRDFIPCYRKSDGVRGLYDTVNDVFYTNAGSGTFEIGPEV